MSMPATNAPVEWTADMVRALPEDGKRYEVLDGELFVTPAPSRAHQQALAAMFRALDPYVRSQALGELLWSPADIEFSPRRLVQPDLFVVPVEASGRRETWQDVRSLVLAIEALSPSTAFADRNRKRAVFQQQAVGEYWILHLDARLVERWRPEDERPEVLTATIEWRPAGASEPLRIELQRLFDSVLGPPEQD
jgi:Uma2 family endonuclease